ncbi:glycoside hydrolase family 18 [Sphingobacterium hungaricum]
MKKYTNFTSIFLASLFVLTTTASCEKWTENEALKIEQPSIEEQNPGLYAKYLEDLRAYKNSDHKIVIGFFDNTSKTPSNQSQSIANVPDSLDILVLNSVDLSDRELQEAKSIRDNKGTKTVFEIDFDKIKSDYDLRAVSGAVPDFKAYIADTISYALSLSTKYAYDGVLVSYLGKNTTFLTEEEKQSAIDNETIVMNLVKQWGAANTSKVLMLKGYPQYIIDKTVLKDFSYIILNTSGALSKSVLTFELLSALVADVPSDRFIAVANSTSIRADEPTIGYFSDGTRSTQSTAEWVLAANNGATIKGLAITNIQYDYFNILKVYKATRETIDLLNPSIK